MNLENIQKNLKHNNRILIYDVVSSTNIVAKELASQDAKEGTVVIAKSQTNGRGRLGRSFISSSDKGLYMSIILRPDIPVDECVNITVMASVAVLEAIESTANINAEIKWVNDIFINDKKICGILTESSYNFESDRLEYVICGIGVNIEPPKDGFSEKIKDIAGAIFENEAPSDYKSILCTKIIDNFFEYYNGKKMYMSTYKKKSNIIGKNVDVYIGERIVSGKAIDINEKAELIVKKENGEICVFNSGEARVRKSGVGLSDK